MNYHKQSNNYHILIYLLFYLTYILLILLVNLICYYLLYFIDNILYSNFTKHIFLGIFILCIVWVSSPPLVDTNISDVLRLVAALCS